MADHVAGLLYPVIDIAEKAAARILEIYGTAFDIEEKSDESPLTEADLAAHRTIVDSLRQLTPEIPILSEESADVAFGERAAWRQFWLVDPLDGTKEFVRQIGEFTVNIALIENHESVLGVVQVPVSGICYFAARSQGAFRREPHQASQRIAVRPLDQEPVRVVGSRSHDGKSLDAFLDRLGEHRIVRIGSSLKLCLVAEGEADIYPRLGPTSEWDTAAAQCIVEEAGGRVITVGGERLLYNTKESLLNPHFLVIGDARRDWLSYLPEQD